MKVLKYKGLIFDDYCQNDDGTYWAEICDECAKKYIDKIANEIDDGDTAICNCSIKGCYNNGQHREKHFYIDFDNRFVKLERENTEYDNI